MHIVHDTSAIGFVLVSVCLLMVLMLGEQNCYPHKSFTAKVNIEDATCRGTLFERFQGAHKCLKNQ